MDNEALLALLQKYREAYVNSTRGGREVHTLWRDGMLAQGRQVAPERMSWDTLDTKDRWLDHIIAGNLVDDYLSFVGDQLVLPQE